jgi:hypothetical protein
MPEDEEGNGMMDEVQLMFGSLERTILARVFS